MRIKLIAARRFNPSLKQYPSEKLNKLQSFADLRHLVQLLESHKAQASRKTVGQKLHQVQILKDC